MPSKKTSIRKALEGRLKPILVAQDIPLILPNFGDDLTAGVTEYVRMTVHHGKRIVREIGNAPRIDMDGFALFGVFTPTGTGSDRNDTIAGIVEDAYPYNLDLPFGGVTVNIAACDMGDAVPIPGWWYAAVTVNWNVWRI